jgi:protein SPT2
MRIDSDSEEYDSEMDDFIDDSDAKIDVSAQIRNIFGYDRRKFRDEDDFDDRSMETNRFSDVMKEEARSARIGKMEDMEDIRREEEEKRRNFVFEY